MSDVAIIDNGGANIASLRYALERLGATSHLTADADELRAASRVILPGVGAAAAAALRRRWAGRRQPQEPVPPEPGSPGALYLEHLAAAVRIPTVSHEDRSLTDPAPFAAFHAFLEATYPLVHQNLSREVVGQPAAKIAALAQIPVPPETTFLMVLGEAIGAEDLFSGEKLSPVLTLWRYDHFSEAVNLVTDITGADAFAAKFSDESIRSCKGFNTIKGDRKGRS